nr:MAG TPA: hypothetical protein [Caudoviricetes sp.]
METITPASLQKTGGRPPKKMQLYDFSKRIFKTKGDRLCLKTQ